MTSLRKIAEENTKRRRSQTQMATSMVKFGEKEVSDNSKALEIIETMMGGLERKLGPKNCDVVVEDVIKNSHGCHLYFRYEKEIGEVYIVIENSSEVVVYSELEFGRKIGLTDAVNSLNMGFAVPQICNYAKST